MKKAQKLAIIGLFGSLMFSNFAKAAGPQLAIVTQPAVANINSPLGSLEVQIQDAGGVIVNPSSNDLTFHAYSDAQCQNLSPIDFTTSINTITVTNGQFDFGAISYPAGGNIYFGVTSPGFASACSNVIFIKDTIPNASSFNLIINAPLNNVETSNTITVSGINAPTSISISDPTNTGSDGEYSINGAAFTNAAGTVSNGDSVTIRQTSASTYATLKSVKVTIGGVSANFQVITMVAPNVNVAPVLNNIPDQNVLPGNQATFTAHATDANGDAVTYSLGSNAPQGATIDTNTGNFVWTPTQVGTFTFDVIASDGSLTDTKSVNVIVSETPVATPVVSESNNNHKDEHCGSITCEKYREYKKKYKSDANRKLYFEIRDLQKSNSKEFSRLESVYMTNKKLSKNEISKLTPKVQNDFKTFKKYNGYKHYRTLKKKI